jgi:hypothetical protein
VAKETDVALRSELFAKSGTLLKVLTQTQIEKFGERHYPRIMQMSDALKKGTNTSLILEDVKFDVDIPGRTFSRRALMQGGH